MSEFVSETAKKAGDRDLTKFEVMQIHAEYWQWSNKEIAALRRQVADAKEENERVRQANLHTMDVFEDMKAAKEKAEARVAELLTICQAVQRDLLLRAEPDWDGSGQKVVNLSAGFWEELNRVIGKYDDTACKSFDALIIRKQSEAVEDIRKDLLSDLPDHPVSRQVAARLELRVNSLREKAERAGGEK